MLSRKQIVHVDSIRSGCRSPDTSKRPLKDLKIELRPLSAEDAASCYALELTTFAPLERATLEKVGAGYNISTILAQTDVLA